MIICYQHICFLHIDLHTTPDKEKGRKRTVPSKKETKRYDLQIETEHQKEREKEGRSEMEAAGREGYK